MITQYVERLLEDIRGKQKPIKHTLASNAVNNMEQYRFLNGKLQGLEEGKALVEELYKKMVEMRVIEGNLDSKE